MTSSNWLQGLNPQQLEAVTWGDGPLLVVAGAGTGKTRTLASRVAHLISKGVPAEKILLLTFTRRAAKEMLLRAETALGSDSSVTAQVWSGTFHAIANRILRIYGQSLELEPEFTIMDQGDAEDMLDVIRQKKIENVKKGRFPRKSTLLAIYSKRMNSGEDLEFILKREFPWCQRWHDELKIIFKEYATLKQQRSILDYDDLLQYWFFLLQDKKAASILGKRFEHILVDEYQDVNKVQADILMLMRQECRNIMVVGDDAQSIYSFRAASVRNMLDFPTVFPGTNIVKLEENYRSSEPILKTTNQLIASARERFAKQLFTKKAGGESPKLITCTDEEHEAEQLVEKVLGHYEAGIPLREQAVLFRASSHSATLEIALMKKEIPFHKYGGLKFLEAAHVKDFLALFRSIENRKDEPAWFRILQLLEGVGPATAAAVYEHLSINQFSIDALSTAPVSASIRQDLLYIRKLHIDVNGKEELSCAAQLDLAGRYYLPILEQAYDNAQARKNDIEHIIELGANYKSRAQFLNELMLDPPSSTSDLAGPPKKDEDYLILSTIHSAKGCEWDAVYLIHAADGCIPSDMATENQESIDEELRLAYVAMTRARKYCYVSWPMRFYSRPSGFSDRHVYAQCSRFFTKEVCETMELVAAPDEVNVNDEAAQNIDSTIDIKSKLRGMWD